MAWLARFKAFLRKPRGPHANAPAPTRPGRDTSGLALFMVLSAVSVLSILVTEFTYIAQINQRIAYDGLDQVKAHYLAKSGVKLSLLRLKAYQLVKGFADNKDNAAAAGMLPKGVLEKLWSFPFFYPIPANIPGMGAVEKEKIDKFQKETSLEGSFSASIQSESGKYNLNMILAPFAPTGSAGTGTTGPSGDTGSTGTTGTSGTTASTGPAFNAETARKSLGEFLSQLMTNQAESDEDFAYEYRDFKLPELVDNLISWADPTFESNTAEQGRDSPNLKQAPYYSLTELHMIDLMDDRLYDLFAPALTVNPTPGINVNTMDKVTTRALVPQMTAEETTEFFKFRDSEEEDNLFKKPDDFFAYLKNKVAAFRGSQTEVDRYKEDLDKRNIRIVTDESQFRIVVQAQVNQATRLIDMSLTMQNPNANKGGKGGAGGTGAVGNSGSSKGKSSGFLIHFVRIL